SPPRNRNQNDGNNTDPSPPNASIYATRAPGTLKSTDPTGNTSRIHCWIGGGIHSTCNSCIVNCPPPITGRNSNSPRSKKSHVASHSTTCVSASTYPPEQPSRSRDPCAEVERRVLLSDRPARMCAAETEFADVGTGRRDESSGARERRGRTGARRGPCAMSLRETASMDTLRWLALRDRPDGEPSPATTTA